MVFPPAPRAQVGAGSGPGIGPRVGSGGVLDGEPPPFVAEPGAFRGDAADTPLSGTGATALVIVAVTWVGTGVLASLVTVVATRASGGKVVLLTAGRAVVTALLIVFAVPVTGVNTGVVTRPFTDTTGAVAWETVPVT